MITHTADTVIHISAFNCPAGQGQLQLSRQSIVRKVSYLRTKQIYYPVSFVTNACQTAQLNAHQSVNVAIQQLGWHLASSFTHTCIVCVNLT